MSKSSRPSANLYANPDGTFSGRFSSAPWVDFVVEMKDDDPLTLSMQAYDVLKQGSYGKEFIFRPNGGGGGLAAAMGMQGGGDSNGERRIQSDNEPTLVLCMKQTGAGLRMKVERHINGGGVAGSLAGFFQGNSQ